MRFFSCTAALLCAALLAVTPCARAQTLTCIVPEGQYVNVRKQAASSAATWGILHGGETIEADPDEVKNGFFKTTFREKEAYVSVRYFETATEETCVVEANGRVRTRKSPGGEALGFVQPGETVRVLGWRYDADGDKWARCTGKRYIAAEFLKTDE